MITMMTYDPGMWIIIYDWKPRHVNNDDDHGNDDENKVNRNDDDLQPTPRYVNLDMKIMMKVMKTMMKTRMIEIMIERTIPGM